MTSRPEQRLLGVFAHPDDETIGAGSLLALAVDAGVDVSVVTCTRGERGEVIPPDLADLARDPDALARHREAELSAALAELGVHRHLFLDQVPGLADQRPARFRDSGMRWVRPGVAGPGEDAGPDAFTSVDVEVAACLLAVVIRHVRPTAVLTEEPGGGYGHPDHVHAHRVTTRAVEIAAADVPAEGPDPFAGLAPWRVRSVLWVAQEETHLRAALTELADTLARHEPRRAPDGTTLTVLDPAAELPRLAVPAQEVVASVDVRPVAERVLAALRRHRSQLQAVAPIDGQRLVGHIALSNASLMPVLDRAYLRAAPGTDATELAAALGVGATRGSAATAQPAAASPEPAAAEPAEGREPAYATAARTGGRAPTPAAPAALHTAATRAGAAQEAATRSVGHPTPTPDAPRAASRARGPLARLVARGGATGVVVAVLAGLVMATLGTVVHRFSIEGWPVGITLGLVGVLAGAVAARAIAGGGGLLLAALSVIVVTQAMAFLRPGGDVLVTNELISYVWLFGAPLVAIASGLLPSRWFADGARGGRRA
ncbi:PIG-L family deacetylase [Georgenia sp. H159]|uniref:PIG-L family deacetylase n=1 Tax=Georgenia sp. H159 TaxID=3076115 RepID=UPI002D770709|nr:PIG-L family deacetylase [Georgenia sp. H159]